MSFDPDATGVIPRITVQPPEPEDEDTAPRPQGKKARKEAKAAALKARRDAADPEAAEPEAASPEVTEPEVTEPEVTEPEAVEPEAVEPEAVEPEPEPQPEPASEAEETPEPDDAVDEDDADVTRPGRLPKPVAPVKDDEEELDLSATVTRRVPSSFAVQIGHPPTPEDVAPEAPAVPKDAPATSPQKDTPTTRTPSRLEDAAKAPSSQQAASAAPAVHEETSAPAKQGVATDLTAAPVKPSPLAVEKAAPKATGIRGILQSAPKWLPVLLTLEGLLMYVLALRIAPGPLRGVDPADIGGLGLISAMPLSAFAAIFIMIVAFFVTVSQSSDRKFLLLFQIAVITFALHGAGAIVADAPRFPTAYVHAGFVDYISRTGESSIVMDARMGWPGFFALFSFVTKTAGITDLTPILMWTPLLSNLLYLLPFVLILRQVVATTRARWFAALLFILVQWIGQDYFSPQGFTFALYLAFVAILLRWFGRVEERTKPIPPKGKVRRLLAKLDAMMPGELANTGMWRADKLLMLILLILLFVAATASHQITPFMMLGTLTAFLIFKRTSLTWALPFFFGLMVLAWISYQTVGFWSNNIDTIFGGLGRLLDNLQRGTGDRISGSDPVHALVLKTRLGICAAVLGLALVGFIRRMRRGVFDRAAVILLCVPALAMGLQSYGGEMPLRVYMFALPGACLLAAYAFFPNMPADSADARDETVPVRKRNVRFNPELTKKLSLVLAATVAMVFALSFLVARYGNEKFERVTPSEVAAMRYVYEHDKPSARVLYLVPKTGPESTPILPWGERDYERTVYEQVQVFKDPKDISSVVKKLQSDYRNTFLVVTDAQAAYLELNEGFPKGWADQFRATLDGSKLVKKVYSGDDAAVYTLKKFVKGTEIPEPNTPSGVGDPTTPWDLVGLIALGVFWPALFAYEVIRLHGDDRARKARRRLLYVAIPAFALSLGVIIERFIYIAMNK
ncbi:hypothetical protein ACIBG8_38620 [Nonomuraea sp. NPDC050556]|uniref:hypothetical protein n=1 Tax=Nonomuraea sp. NPDC050556 TaxID=3364369 RepID=UPI0037A77E57